MWCLSVKHWLFLSAYAISLHSHCLTIWLQSVSSDKIRLIHGWTQGDYFSGKPGKVRNFFKSGKSQGKQAKSGKCQGNHDCAILSASITNSNFTSKSTQNAHICIEVFKIFPRGHTPGPLDTYIDPVPLTASQLDFGANAPRLKAFSISLIHSRPYWKSQGKVRAFHLAWRVVTLCTSWSSCSA